MSHLDKLNISNRIIAAAHPNTRTRTIKYRRRKLIANIEEQIELVELARQNRPLQLQRKRGHQILPVKPRLWWKQSENGSVLTHIRYNKVALNLAGRGTTIEAASLEHLLAVYATVIEAVKAGELDEVIKSAADKSAP